GDQLMGGGAYLAGLGSALLETANRVRARARDPFRLLEALLRERAAVEGESDERMLITRAVRVQPVWSDVQIAAEELHAAIGALLSLLEDLRAILETGQVELLNQEGVLAEVADATQTAYSLSEGLGSALLREDQDLICWLERDRRSGEVAVCTAPLQVSEVLRRYLFEEKETVVLTSATLSAEGSFDYLRERVGLDEAEELMLGSPFDYPGSTLIALPTDLPE